MEVPLKVTETVADSGVTVKELGRVYATEKETGDEFNT
jgi:hypothetical protein